MWRGVNQRKRIMVNMGSQLTNAEKPVFEDDRMTHSWTAERSAGWSEMLRVSDEVTDEKRETFSK